MIKTKIRYIFVFSFVFLLCTTKSYAAYPTLISKLQSAFESIQSWLLALATPAAGISIATGAFMKKFSFGDDEKIRTGKKLIRTALFSYVFILLLKLILTTISNLLS
ncbi:MAG: hypothetical protein IJH12_01240 [Clostridia bacterium]|nr:hypothetical protein [Clostridia bacterium]